MSLSARRYQESPKNQSAFLLSTKITASREKANANNSSVSLPKNPELQIRLPSLSRSSMRKSFSTFESDRNTKFKLQTLQDKLEEIKHYMHNTRQEAKETFELTKVMRQTLIEKELGGINKDLRQKIQGLNNLVRITINQQKDRSNELRDQCRRLWDSNQQIKSLAFQLRMKVEDIERSMGYKQ